MNPLKIVPRQQGRVNVESAEKRLLPAQAYRYPDLANQGANHETAGSSQRFDGDRHAKRFMAKIVHLFLNSPVVRPPGLNGLLDVGAGQFFVERPFRQFSHFGVGGEAERDELPFGQLRNSRSHRLGAQSGEAQTLFQANDAVLRFERIGADLQNNYHRSYRDNEEGTGVKARTPKEMDRTTESSEDKNRQCNQVKERIELGMVRQGLRRFFSHRFDLLERLGHEFIPQTVNGQNELRLFGSDFDFLAKTVNANVHSVVGSRNANRLAGRHIEVTMKAILVKLVGGPEAMELVELPVPRPTANEAVVKLAASGVNFIDVYFREGRYKSAVPFVPGQEGAGTVTEVGTDVRSVKVGDRVAWSGLLGSYAEYAAVPAERLVPVPEAVSDQQAGAAMLQGMTAHYLTHSTYPLKQGETVLIHAAAGGVGLLLVQMAHNIGARVIATVSTEEKAKLARGAGAHEVILYGESDFEAETKRLTGGKGIDVIYDSVGKTTFAKGLNLLRPRGMMVLFGGSSGAVPPFDLMTLAHKGSLFVTRPTLGHYIATRNELLDRAGAVFNMLASGKLNLRIEHTYPLADAPQAHRDLEGRKTTGKLLLLP